MVLILVLSVPGSRRQRFVRDRGKREREG